MATQTKKIPAKAPAKAPATEKKTAKAAAKPAPAKKSPAKSSVVVKAATAKVAAKPTAKSAAKPAAKAAAPAKAANSHPIGGDVFQVAREQLWSLDLENAGKALEKRGFAVSIAPTLQDAAKLVLQKILPESGAASVAFGGSMTVVKSGIYDALKKAPKLKFFDTYDAGVGHAAFIECRRQALLADMYFCSVNALTKDGEVVLLDGIGNRTASVQFGPKNVVLLVGRNKLCEDLDAGITRVKTVAAPANAMRLSRNTPCTKTGHCMDCKSPESICSVWTIMTRCAPAKRIHVVLINEDIGY